MYSHIRSIVLLPLALLPQLASSGPLVHVVSNTPAGGTFGTLDLVSGVFTGIGNLPGAFGTGECLGYGPTEIFMRFHEPLFTRSIPPMALPHSSETTGLTCTPLP